MVYVLSAVVVLVVLVLFRLIMDEVGNKISKGMIGIIGYLVAGVVLFFSICGINAFCNEVIATDVSHKCAVVYYSEKLEDSNSPKISIPSYATNNNSGRIILDREVSEEILRFFYADGII